jgi:hypothetical protein
MWMFNLWMFFSAVLSLSSVITFIVYLSQHSELMDPGVLKHIDFTNLAFTNSLACWIIVLVFILPLVLAILHSPSSFVLMLKSLVPYYLFLPMIVGFFGAYSFARCWDLSWGNRPAGNVLTHKMKEDQQQRLKGMASTMCAFIVVMNCTFFLLQASALSQIGGMFYLASALFATTLLQMVIGLFWFATYDIRRIRHFLRTRIFWYCFHLPAPECCFCCYKQKDVHNQVADDRMPLRVSVVMSDPGNYPSSIPQNLS